MTTGLPTCYSTSKPLFGGEIEIVIATDTNEISTETIQSKVDEIYTYGLSLQKIFNFYDPTSELSLLNKNRVAEVSSTLRKLIEMGLSMCDLTNGAYDISLGKYILERKNKKTLSPQACSYKDITVNENTITLTHPDAQIDLGSIAKGYITDCLAKACTEKGLSGLLDARGDIIAFGKYSEKIGIQDPRNNDKEVGNLVLHNNAVATSGDYKQYDTSYDTSHILHQGSYASITVVTPTLTEADMLATALFVAPYDMRQTIIHKYSHAAIVCILPDGTKEIYNDTSDIFTLTT